MKIVYGENPFVTKVLLTDIEKLKLWYELKVRELEERLYDAHFHLTEEKYKDDVRVLSALDPSYYTEEDDGVKSKLDQRVDRLYGSFVGELEGGFHVGDCTCVPCSCVKCHAESMVGVDTIALLGKHEAHVLWDVFMAEGNEDITCIEVYERLVAKGAPVATEDWHVGHIDRWGAEYVRALKWLKSYMDVLKGTTIER